MELKILSNTENKLIKRKEIAFSVAQEGGTVKRSELSKELCKKLSLHPENVLIVRIDQGYGIKESSGMAHAYESREMLEKYEPKNVLARIAKKAAKGKEAGAEAKEEGN
jgi:small subunit ribosomal protein S24e